MNDELACPLTPSGRSLRCNYLGGSNENKNTKKVRAQAEAIGKPMPKKAYFGDMLEAMIHVGKARKAAEAAKAKAAAQAPQSAPSHSPAPAPQAPDAGVAAEAQRRRRTTVLAGSGLARRELGGATVLGGGNTQNL
jgi:hypothetical protein